MHRSQRPVTDTSAVTETVARQFDLLLSRLNDQLQEDAWHPLVPVVLRAVAVHFKSQTRVSSSLSLLSLGVAGQQFHPTAL